MTNERLENRTCLLVLGMHRSGTSALTRVLSLMGARLPKNIMPGSKGNELGHWESKALVEIHDDMLAEAGSFWCDWREFNFNALTEDRQEYYRSKIRSAIKEDYDNDSLIVIKDPRICRFVPLYREVLGSMGISLRPIIVLREPEAVYASLNLRNGIDASYSRLVWIRHVLDSELFTRDLPRSVVSYRKLLDDWRSVVEKLSEQAAVEWTRTYEAAKVEVNDFLSHDQNHHDNLKADMRAMDTARNCHEQMVKLIGDPGDKEACSKLDGQMAAFRHAEYLFGPAFENEQKKQILIRKKRHKSINMLKNSRSRLNKSVSELKLSASQLEIANKKLVEDGARLDFASSEIKASRDKLDVTKAELKVAGDLLEISNHKISITNAQLELANSRNEATEGRLVVANSDLRNLRTELEAAQSNFMKSIVAIDNYNSVKIKLVSTLRMLANDYSRKSHSLAENLTHLERINLSPWWRFGMSATDIAINIGISSKFMGRIPIKIDVHDPILTIVSGVIEEAEKELIVPYAQRLKFPGSSKDPLVSILVLSYGKVDLTLKCLESISRHYPSYSCEVIVSDDRSLDSNLDSLRSISGLKLFETEINMGWLQHVNWAVERCSGKYVLLLNNDVEVGPNAIDALIATIISSAKIAMAGSKLIYPDQTLQEAGGIVWSDASAWNYGRHDSPEKPEYNYVREVDYISGACLLISKEIWKSLEGFDERYSPAYYEETDLAFRVREAGYKVIYQPASVVTHLESATYGADSRAEKSALLERNRNVFYSRWEELLSRSHFKNGQNIYRARERSDSSKVMVIVDHYAPEPDKDAGSKTIMNFIDAVLELGWRIKFWPDNLRHSHYINALQQKGIEVAYAPWNNDFLEWIRSRDDIDLFLISRPEIAYKYLPIIKSLYPRTPIHYYGHDLHHSRLMMESMINHDSSAKKESIKLKEIERTIWKSSDLSIYLSREEADVVKLIEPDAAVTSIVPYYFETSLSSLPPTSSKIIIFVAGFAHPPNIDACLWFAREIFPIIKSIVADARFMVVGSNPVQDILDLAGEDIEVTGYVSSEHLSSLYTQ